MSDHITDPPASGGSVIDRLAGVTPGRQIAKTWVPEIDQRRAAMEIDAAIRSESERLRAELDRVTGELSKSRAARDEDAEALVEIAFAVGAVHHQDEGAYYAGSTAEIVAAVEALATPAPEKASETKTAPAPCACSGLLRVFLAGKCATCGGFDPQKARQP